MSMKMLEGDNLSHELFLTTREKTKLRNAFENNLSTDIKSSKTQISKLIQSGGFLGSLKGSFLGSLNKTAGPLMKVAVPVAKSVLAALEIRAAASAIDTRIQKKYLVLERQH